MEIIGITGPSGAGKTTALRVLEQMGGRVFDCDAIYHRLLETDGELLGRIEAAFPGAVKNYVLDRKALGARVFADPEGLDRLTGLTQPIVAARVLAELEAAASGRRVAAPTGNPPPPRHSERSEESVPPSPQFAVIDAIGLFESGIAAHCSRTVAVIADAEVRVRRLMARDGVCEAYARSRIAAQKPASWYAEQADLVLENNGSEADFEIQCREMFQNKLFKEENHDESP